MARNRDSWIAGCTFFSFITYIFGCCNDQFYLWNCFVEWGKCAFYGQGYGFFWHHWQRPSYMPWLWCIIVNISCEIDFVGIIKPVCDQIQEGVDRVRCSLLGSANIICTIETCAYYIPEARICLFLPQVYFQENKGGSLVLTQDGVIFNTANW